MTSPLLALFLALEATATAPAAPGPAPELADLRGRIEAAERDGDRQEADSAAITYLDAAGMTALTAAWGAPAKPGADRQAGDDVLDQATAFVIPLAVRHENWWLLIRALAWNPRAAEANRPSLRRALAGAAYAVRFLPDDVVRAVATDPTVAVELALHRSDRSAPITVAQAQAAGEAGLRWLDQEVGRALEAGDREAARRAAEALAARDPKDLRAVLALEVLQEDPQRLRRANLELKELVPGWYGDAGQTLIRLQRALAHEPGAVRLRLAAAWRQLQIRASADARREANAIAADGAAPPRVREAAETIAALAALDLGQGAAFTQWLSRQAGRPSPFVAEHVLGSAAVEKAVPPTVAEARRAVLARLLPAQPPAVASDVQDAWRWLAIKDDKLDAGTRRRALDMVFAADAGLAPVARSCGAEKLAFDACVARLETVVDLRDFDEDDDDDDDDEGDHAVTVDPAALPRLLGPNLEIPASFLVALRTLPPEKVAQLAPWLDGLRARPVARTRPFALLDVMVRWARKDPAGARRAIDEALPRLMPRERVALRLLADDVERKLITADRAAVALDIPTDVASVIVGRPATGPEPEWMADAAPGKDRSSTLRRGLTQLGSGYGRRALETLRPLLGALSGPERGEIAGYVFLAAVAAGDDKVRAQAAAEVSAYAPGSAAALRIAAVAPLLAPAAADAAGPDRPAARWLRSTPDSDGAAEAWLAAATSRAGATSPGAHAQDLLARAGRIQAGGFARVAALLSTAPRADAACWKAAIAADDIDRLSACPAGALVAIGKAAPGLEFQSNRRIEAARDAAGIVRAARTAALLAGDQPGPRDPHQAWLWYVAGDFARSRAALGKADASAEDQPLPLVMAAKPESDPRRRRELYRQFASRVRGPESDADDDDARPALDWSAAARDAATPRRRAEIWQLACLAISQPPRRGNALAACGAAWRQGRRTPGVATGLAAALFGDIEAARKEGWEAKVFLAEARKALGDRLPGEISAHEARWLVTLGRNEEAARSYEAAWAAGAGEIGEGVPAAELATAPFNPVLTRYRAAVAGTPARKAFALALVSVSAGDMEAFAAYTAQSRAFHDAEADRADAKGLVLFEDLLAMISADTAERTLDRPGIVRLARRLFEPGTKEPMADVERDYPRSTVVSLLVLEDGNAGDPKLLIDRAKALAARFPRTSVVAADCAAVLMRAGRPREANAIWNTAKAAHPGDPFVHGALAGTEPAAPAPATAMFASAQSWARTLSAPVEVPADALALQQIRDDEHAISAVLPAAFKKESMGGPGIKFANGDVNIVFMRIPRMTYCEGLACLDQLIPTFQLQGFKKQWRRVLTTPVGPGAEALLTTAGRGLLVAAIPAGGDIYFLMAGGAMDQMAAQVNALRMAYRTFRPLGLVLPQPVAGRLLPYYAAGDHRSQLQERLATATPSAIARGCPLRAVIDATDAASTRRGLLLDAFLTTPWSATRLRLLDCEAGGPLSPALTIAGLWDDDRAVRKAAAARAAADPGGVLTEAKRLMSGDVPIEPGAGSTGASHNHRWLQLLLSLPPKERGELARALLRRDEPHLRAVGLLAPRFCEVDLGRELHRIVRDGATADVRIALRAFPEELGPPLRDAVWARFDRARAPLADAEKTLLFDLGEQLARAPAAGDRARLERLLRLVSSGAARRQPAAVADQLKVEALLHPAPRSRAALPAGGPIPAADRPLSRLLPGNRWSYFSLPRPDLLLSRLGRLGRRLKASSRERQTLSQAVVSRVIAEASSVAADPGGIDLGRPIECAAPDGRMGDLICAAALRPDGPDDPGDMLRALGVIQMVTGGAVVLPVMLPGLPFILHDSVYRRPESTGAGQRTALVRESADQSLDTPAGALTWTTAIDISSDGAGDVDDKIVLRSKNRLLFSNAPALARRFLIPAGTAGRPAPAPAPAPTSLSSPSSPPPLAEDPDFVRASGRFVEGADLTAVVVNSEPGQTGPRGAVALEMTITTRGMAARVRLPFRQGGLDHRAGALARALPKGPALLFGAGEIDWGSDGAGQHAVWPDAMSLPPADDAGVAPPTWLGAVTGALAFGWYPRAGGHFWDSWIGIVTWDDKVAAAWRRHGMPEPSRDGKPSVSDGYRFQLAGQTLLVANDQALLDEAARKQAAGAAAGAEEPVTGLFDGGRVASSLEDIAERAPSKDAGMTLRSWAALASVVKSATLSSTVDRQRGEVVIESLLSPEMEGATPTALVDEWVAESRIRNTLMLPRALPPSDGGKPIRFTLDVEHDKNFTRAFPTTARQQVERVGQGHWRVSVSPSPRIDQPVRAETMSAGERTRWLDAENVSPRIASAAREIIPDKTDSRQAAQLVLAWMKRNMTYELTPRDVSDETILERRRGDCSEYSKLAVALLRARGIPARTRSGFLAESATLVAHAWVEFFDGTGWREIDPVAGTASVDARHIDASVADVLSLLSLAQIRVAGVE